MFYPIMLEGIKLARDRGFQVGVVTNAYFATDDKDIEIWLKPLCELGIANLSISNDPYHYEGETENPAIHARKVALKLNMPAKEISIEKPSFATGVDEKLDKGEPVIGGGTLFRGSCGEIVGGSPAKMLGGFY